MSKSLKAGVVQFDVKLGNLESNLASALEGIGFLGSQNADIAVLPEMWTCGFDNENLAAHAQKTPAILEKLSETARRQNIMIAGSVPDASGDDIFNTLWLTDKDGSVAGAYRKVHLFSLTGEEKYFRAGNQHMVCQTSAGPVGLMICYDIRFPELCRTLALKGALVVLVSAQWPLVRISRWNTLVSARAIENQVFMVAANRCGTENGLEFGGHSQIVSPLGNVLARGDTKTRTLCASLDFRELETCRNEIPSLEERVLEAYEL